MTHTNGTIRAVEEISNLNHKIICSHEFGCLSQGTMFKPKMAFIIDKETHVSEMEAFIEKVATVPIPAHGAGHETIVDLKREALELVEKLRGA